MNRGADAEEKDSPPKLGHEVRAPGTTSMPAAVASASDNRSTLPGGCAEADFPRANPAYGQTPVRIPPVVQIRTRRDTDTVRPRELKCPRAKGRRRSARHIPAPGTRPSRRTRARSAQGPPARRLARVRQLNSSRPIWQASWSMCRCQAMAVNSTQRPAHQLPDWKRVSSCSQIVRVPADTTPDSSRSSPPRPRATALPRDGPDYRKKRARARL